MGAVNEAFRRGYSIEDVRDLTGGKNSLVPQEVRETRRNRDRIRAAGEIGMRPAGIPESEMRSWKGAGFTDLHIADALWASQNRDSRTFQLVRTRLL
ncbi:MAG: hypothetical protein Ct9H90mP24_4090 [Methanobacteriota archaeon]|nr:MAG: hypothetical protein Ct9H90mP24_4090 [Euryarchaeota archaeon]